MSEKMHLFAVVWAMAPDVFSASALIPHKPLIAHRAKASSGAGGLTMYFDDVSRSQYTLPWHLSGVELRGGGRPEFTGSQSDSIRTGSNIGDSNANLARDKAKALTKHLYGHDVESATKLLETDVEVETKLWAESTGLVGPNRSHSPYGEISGLRVCKALSTLGCIAEFWNVVTDVISENTDSQGLWEVERDERSRIVMVLFPACADLYDYTIASTVSGALGFCGKDSSSHFGKDFSVNTYHPRWKNSPKMIEPMRHSPFPIFALHIAGEEDRLAGRTVNQEEHKEKPSKALTLDDYEYIPQLRERRRSLERLLYSTAASPKDGFRGKGVHDVDSCSDDAVIEQMKTWIRSSKMDTEGHSFGSNRALQFADTVEERWIVTNEHAVESIYADIWNEIRKLYDNGCDVSNLNEELNRAEKTIISTMFITPNFSAYNAMGFKKFAVTVNAALKHITAGKMFIELFHPEYVGPKGYHNGFRRSPAPAIQICYKL